MSFTSGSNFSLTLDTVCDCLDMFFVDGDFFERTHFCRVCFYCFFFMTHNSKKMNLLVQFFGETPSRHIVTCLLLCAARDLKSSQCAVHVVGPVHCTQRKQRPCVN